MLCAACCSSRIKDHEIVVSSRIMMRKTVEYKQYKIPKGTHGTVVAIDQEGDVEIEFDDGIGKRWVMSPDVGAIADADGDPVHAALEFLPKSKTRDARPVRGSKTNSGQPSPSVLQRMSCCAAQPRSPRWTQSSRFPAPAEPLAQSIAESAGATQATRLPDASGQRESVGQTNSQQEHPNLAGKWEVESTEGLDEFLSHTGGGFQKLNATEQATSGVSPWMEISVHAAKAGEEVRIVNHTAKGVTTLEFVTDGKRFQGNFGPEQERGIGTASWDQGGLVVRLTLPGMTTETRRRLKDGKLVEHTTCTKGGIGATMTRVWSRSGTAWGRVT